MPIIFGNNFLNDVLVGTADADAINGLGGDDWLNGGAGADILNGGAGWDLAYYGDSSAGVTVNLTTGQGAGGDAEGDTLFNVEALEGSAFNDVLTGNSGSNNIVGGDGDDVILGFGGAFNVPGSFDFLDGGNGNDTIVGHAAGIHGGAGADRLIAIDTGVDDSDFTTMLYRDSPAAIFANLTAGLQGGLAGGDNTNGFRISDGWGDVDLVSGFTTATDSDHNDVFHVDSTYQSAYGNWIEIRLSRGDDQIVFSGVDSARVSYRDAGGAVVIDLDAGTATDRNIADSFIGSDTFSGANQARGTFHDDEIYGRDSGNDRLLGDRGNDTIFGRGGDDILIGDNSNAGESGDDWLVGGAGADHLDGWEGFDFAAYDGSSAAVTVNLATGQASGGDAEGDTFANIEALSGSDHNDTLTGNMRGNNLYGGWGDDTLNGGGVTTVNDWDFIMGQDGNDTITIIGLGSAVGGTGNDRIIGQWSGASEAEELDFIGAQYWDATSGIFANLTAAGGNNTAGFAVNDGQGGTDLVSGVHQFSDSSHNDVFQIDSSYLINFGPSLINWIEIQLTTGDDTVTATGVAVAGVNYSNAGGAVLLDLAIGAAADLNPADNHIGDDSLSGINRARGTSFNDELYGSAGDDQLRGRWGDDVIHGRDGNDMLFGDERAASGFGGNDTLVGGRGFDTIFGGAGDFDTAVFEGLNGGGHLLMQVDGFVYALDRMDQSYDVVYGDVEFFSDGVQWIDVSQISAPTDSDALNYAASYDDLAMAFRTNADAAGMHFLNSGFFEGRETSFEASQYLANWADLAGAFGSDTAAARAHFLLSGVDEHRLAEDPLDYIASFADLSAAFAGMSLEQTKSAGLSHYMGGGWSEGRRGGIDFDAEQYLANNADLNSAFAGDDDLAAWHFINAGRSEGRMWEDPLEYIASFGDLIGAFGSSSEAELHANGLSHFRSIGSEERDARRSGIDFDAEQYLANYDDLRAAFADGTGGYDEHAATLHFIRSGFSEGRVDDPLIA